CAFEIRDDAAFHFLGGKSAVLPDNADDRDINIRKDVDGHGCNGNTAKNGDQYRHDHKRVRSPERQPYYPHPTTFTLIQKRVQACRRATSPTAVDPEECDPLSRDHPGLAALYAASISGPVAFGPNAGRRPGRTG